MHKLKYIKTLTALAVMAISISSSQAAITYVDAQEGASGNTFATGGSLGDTTWQLATTAQDEDQWGQRSGVDTNSDSVFQGMHEIVTSDDLPELTTQITGLADGTYTIWAFYWDQVVSDTQNWILSTGLTSGSLATYSSPGEPAVTGAVTTNVTDAGSLNFTGTVDVIANPTLATERRMFGVNLGEVTVSGGSAVNVFIDNNIGNSSLNRAWFDGVGYELVPEPSSTALLGLGGLTLLLRRRR